MIIISHDPALCWHDHVNRVSDACISQSLAMSCMIIISSYLDKMLIDDRTDVKYIIV